MRNIGAATALWLWHDWKKSGRALGWHRSGALSEFRELQGYGRVQSTKGISDPTARAAVVGDIALTVDRILRELPEEQAACLIMSLIERMTNAEIGEHFGHSREWVRWRYQAAHELFCARMDGRTPDQDKLAPRSRAGWRARTRSAS